jgi:predicted dehydrogenase
VVVGLVGCGVWGAHVLRDLRSLACDVRVVARSPESVRRAKDGGATAIVSDLTELGDIHGVVVVTPIATHASVVEQVLRLDVPSFVEKPLCDDAADATHLAEEGAGRIFVMDKWRYHPGVGALAELARSQVLGSVRELRTMRVQPSNRHAEDCSWVLTPHDLAIATEILGGLPEPVRASAEWEGGRVLSLQAELERDGVVHSLEVSERAPVNRRRIELIFEDGAAVLEGGWDEYVTVTRHSGRAKRVEATGELPLLAELRAFVGFLAGGPAPRSSVEEGAAAVHLIAELRALAG